MDSFQNISDKLKELSSFDNAARTKISRLKQLLPEIEKAVEAGVSRVKIVEVLNEYGLSLTLQSYGVMMNRLKNNSKNKLPPKDKIETEKVETKSLDLEKENNNLNFPLVNSRIHKKRIEDEDSDN